MPYDIRIDIGRASLVTDEEREATCGCCGARFTQVAVSTELYAASLRMAEREGRYRCAMEAITDGWVPLYCVPCERYELARTAPLAPFFEKDIGRALAERQRDVPHHKDRRACCDARLRAEEG